MNNWNDPGNATKYDQFARKHSMYRDLSRDLVDIAQIRNARIVVDLGCGSGVTTETILTRLDSDARIFGIDGSEAMLKVARENVSDVRACWVNADSAEIATHVTGADAIICNAAIWQMEMDATLIACGEALRSGGRLAFSILRQSLNIPLTAEELRPTKPTLTHFIQALAVLKHGFVPPHPALARGTTRSQKPLSPSIIRRLITNAGLSLEKIVDKKYECAPEEQYEWLSIPVFADNVLPGMPCDQQMEIIRAAYDLYDKTSSMTRWWKLFVVHKP